MRNLLPLIHSFVEITDQASKLLTALHGTHRTPEEVREALVSKFEVDGQVELLNRNLSSDEIVSALIDFPFGQPTLLDEIDLEESILPESIPRRFVEALVKHRGEIWLVHKYDADPFPSNPHSHNEFEGLKMDLGSGDLYRRRDWVGRIKRKDLIEIRQKLKRVELPELSV